jgi:hypothetical protein
MATAKSSAMHVPEKAATNARPASSSANTAKAPEASALNALPHASVCDCCTVWQPGAGLWARRWLRDQGSLGMFVYATPACVRSCISRIQTLHMRVQLASECIGIHPGSRQHCQPQRSSILFLQSQFHTSPPRCNKFHWPQSLTHPSLRSKPPLLCFPPTLIP